MTLAIDLSGRVALITGGGTGIGRAAAAAVIEAGGRAVITGRTEATLAEACAALGDGAEFRIHDVTATETAEALVDEIERSVGPVDLLVNNAGRHLKRPLVDTATEDLRAVVETNLIGAFTLTRACARRMRDRGRGCIVMVSSMAGLMGLSDVSVYALTKAGLLGLTRSLATELGPSGIRVNAVCPGFIDTAMFRQAMAADPARFDRITGRIPLPDLGTPADIGRAIAFLGSDQGCYLNGVTLPVDGGFAVGF